MKRLRVVDCIPLAQGVAKHENQPGRATIVAVITPASSGRGDDGSTSSCPRGVGLAEIRYSFRIPG